MGSSLCDLCGFNTFSARVVFSKDACCLFPQHVLVVISFIGGVKIWWLLPGLGVLGSDEQLNFASRVCSGSGSSLQPLVWFWWVAVGA